MRCDIETQYVYWATETDEPAGFDMLVLWPLGDKPGDAIDNDRVGGGLTADDLPRLARGEQPGD